MERRQISEERGRREEEERRSEDALPAVNTRSVGEEREEDKGRMKQNSKAELVYVKGLDSVHIEEYGVLSAAALRADMGD
ncbi:hypothetical protein Tco_0472511 [Tanacetum coccineum]